MTRQTGSTAQNGGRPCVLMLLTNAYDPDPRVRQEALALLSFGCDVRILAWDRDLKSRPYEQSEGVIVERVCVRSTHGRGWTQLFIYALLYLRMLRRGWRLDFDVVHCHDLDTLPLGYILAKCKRKPLVYDAHESFTDMLTGSVPALLRRFLFGIETLLIRRVDLLITVGEKLRHHFSQRGARRSVSVGNWKRLEEYSLTSKQNQKTRAGLNIPESALTIACITQLRPDRQIPELFDAADEFFDVFVIIGGKGSMEGFVRERAATNDRIRFVGLARPAEIPVYTCAADVVYYGFDPANPNARFSAPNKLYEALAAGRPLITGDFGEIADVVREAQCGIVLPQYTIANIRRAIETLRNPARRAEMAVNALRFGRAAMNWSRGEQILEEEYSRLLRRNIAQPAISVPASR
jgi:glycosyltransferase involved in cell wall biosynthesis